MRDRERERGSGSPDREENKEREKTDVGGNGKTDRETAVGAKGDTTHKPVDL